MLEIGTHLPPPRLISAIPRKLRSNSSFQHAIFNTCAEKQTEDRKEEESDH